MTTFDAWSEPLDAVRPQNAVSDNAVVTGLSFNDLMSFVRLNGLPMLTEASALSLSAVFACVNLIAGTIGCLPLEVYRRDLKTGEFDRLFGDPLWWVFNEEFSPRWLAAHAWEFFLLSLLLRGDGFLIIRRSGPGVRALVPVHPDRVTVLVDAVLDRLVYVVEPEVIDGKTIGQREIIDQDDMIHVAGLGFNGRRGMAPLRHQLAKSGALALATQGYASQFFSNNARPDYVLQTEQKFEAAKVDELKRQIMEKYSGENSHLPMILHSGMSAVSIGLPLEEIQLLGTRQFDIEEIARIFGVPPFMIGHNEKTTSWGSGMEAMGTGFVRYTLRPWLNKIQMEFNRKIHRTAAKYSMFDTTELEKADFKTLIESFRAALGRAGEQPILHVDEVRRALGFKIRTDLQPNPGAAKDAPQPAEPDPK